MRSYWKLWWELRGKEAERSDDPLWQNVMDSMARLKEYERKKRFTEPRRKGDCSDENHWQG